MGNTGSSANPADAQEQPAAAAVLNRDSSDELFTSAEPAAPRPHAPQQKAVVSHAAVRQGGAPTTSEAPPIPPRSPALVDLSRPPPPAGGFLRPLYNPFEQDDHEHFPDLDFALAYDPDLPDDSGESVETLAHTRPASLEDAARRFMPYPLDFSSARELTKQSLLTKWFEERAAKVMAAAGLCQEHPCICSSTKCRCHHGSWLPSPWPNMQGDSPTPSVVYEYPGIPYRDSQGQAASPAGGAHPASSE
jgi:hypothetical protein